MYLLEHGCGVLNHNYQCPPPRGYDVSFALLVLVVWTKMLAIAGVFRATGPKLRVLRAMVRTSRVRFGGWDWGRGLWADWGTGQGQGSGSRKGSGSPTPHCPCVCW